MSKKPKNKKYRPLNDEPPAERKPHIVYYDADGVKIGDDGYPMTPTRTRMHRIFNAFFVWAVLVIVWGLFCCVFAYFQGQDYSFYELVATGGTQLNGFDFAFLLRMEALCALATAILSIALNFIGFTWMYDSEPVKKTLVLLAILGIASVAFEAAALIIVGMPDPICIVNITLAALAFLTMGSVTAEKPTLSKAKPVSKVVKK